MGNENHFAVNVNSLYKRVRYYRVLLYKNQHYLHIAKPAQKSIDIKKSLTITLLHCILLLQKISDYKQK